MSYHISIVDTEPADFDDDKERVMSMVGSATPLLVDAQDRPMRQAL